MCISTGRVLDDPKRPRDYSAEQYLKSPEEMAALFADVPDAIDNTLALAQRCNVEMQLGTYYLPGVPGARATHTLDSLDPQQCARRPGKRAWRRTPLAPGKTPRGLRRSAWSSSSTSSSRWASPATS